MHAARARHLPTALLALTVLASASAPAAARAADLVGVTDDGLQWTAASTMVATGSTATVAGGGNPIYLPDPTRHNGTVALLTTLSGNRGSFCSGSLLGDGRSILTAAHCVSGALSTQAVFYDQALGDIVTPFSPTATHIAITDFFLHPEYTGQVVDENDIAILRLADLAPTYANRYELYGGSDLTGLDFNIAGYGNRSTVGGALGQDIGAGMLRQGDNRYEFSLGDADFAGALLSSFAGTAAKDSIYLSDFDSGVAANDASCLLGATYGLGGTKYCNLGLGIFEATPAPGDSGGPGFVNGQIASVTSFGLRPLSGDNNTTLNYSFGEFAGHVPVYIHADFIRSAMVPEPSTWTVLILGFGAAGALLRRQRRRSSTSLRAA
jgi:hypothetical protein